MTDTYTADEIVRNLQGEAEKAQKLHHQEVNELIEAGRALHGAETFDQASEAVAQAFGDNSRLQNFLGTARQFDRAPDVIVRLAGDERRLAEIAKLPPPRQAVAFAALESEMSSYGRASTGSERTWKNPEVRRGVVSEESWRKDGGAAITDDSAWSRAFDKHMAARSGRVR